MHSFTPRIEQLFENVKRACFGRFLIDIPTTATIVFGPTEVEMPLISYPGEADSIAEHVKEKLAEIEDDRQFLKDGDTQKLLLYGKIINGSRSGQRILFGSKNQVSYSIYSFVPVGKDLFFQYSHGALPNTRDVDEALEILNRVSTMIQIRDERNVPAENGVCVEGGFIPLNSEREKVALGIRLKEFPDVHMSIEVHKRSQIAVGTDLEALYARGKKDAHDEGKGSAYASIKTLRRAPRKLGDWDGHEILFRMPFYREHTDSHEFRYRSLGALNDAFQPQLDIQLDTGVKDNQKATIRPSLTDDEAVALWDRLLGSIRIRRPAEDIRRDRDSPVVSIGQRLPSGSSAGVSGWWECVEEGSIDSNAQRYFALGDVLPNAKFRTTPGVWQKIIGRRTVLERPTVWRLVAFESENLVLKADSPHHNGT